MRKILKIASLCIAGIVALCLLGLTGLTIRDAFRVGGLKRRISRIAVGDSRDEVRHFMGEPNASWDRRKTFFWNVEMPAGFAYGKTMDWGNAFHSEFPFFLPFRIRLFGPYSDDFVVEFDDSWIVTGISIPK